MKDRRFLAMVVAACMLPTLVALAAFRPPVNRGAIWLVRRNVTGSIPAGRGVRLTGAVGSDDIAVIAAPTGADAKISGVTFEIDPDDSNVGYMLQVGLSNVQVRIGTAAVSFGDSLHIRDNSGVWETASGANANVYYYALQNCSAGSLCWAAPIGSRPN